MIGAGERNRRIVFERAGTRRSAGGTVEPTGWHVLDGRWARVLFGSGSERAAAAVEQAVQTATFRVVSDSLTRSITCADRIIFRALAWDIAAIAEIGRDEIEFTTTASRG